MSASGVRVSTASSAASRKSRVSFAPEGDGGCGLLRRVEHDLAVALIKWGPEERFVYSLKEVFQSRCLRCSAKVNASEREAIMAVMRKLPPSLTAWACEGRFPTTDMPRENTWSTGAISSTRASGPRNRQPKLSFRCYVGASKHRCAEKALIVAARVLRSSRWARATLIVDMEICTAPALSIDRECAAPKQEWTRAPRRHGPW